MFLVRLVWQQTQALHNVNSAEQATIVVSIKSFAQHVHQENIVLMQQRHRHRRAQIALQENMVCNTERQQTLSVALVVLAPFLIVPLAITSAHATRVTLQTFQQVLPSRHQGQEQCKR